MPDTPFDYLAVLRILRERGVEFIIVGGVAAVLHGAPAVTFDLDVVHARSPENIDRLLDALRELEAFYRVQEGTRLVPGPSHLASPGQQILQTRHGRLDLLGTVTGGRGYEELLAESEIVELGDFDVLVVGLEGLVRLKEEAGRDKDRAHLPLLRALLRLGDADGG